MDSLFLLGVEPCRRFLQNACRILGCSYICLWSPLYDLPSKNLRCIEGWFEDDGRPSSLSSSRSLASRFFDSYCGCLCSTENGCVPGLAFKGGLPYIELVDSDLMKLASIPIQRQFYQEAGIKTALFMGCSSGEIELGTKSLKINIDNNYMYVSIQQVFSQDFIQKFQLANTVAVSATDHRPSSTSSSSSLRSLTPVGSPDELPVPVTRQVIMQAYGSHQYQASQLPAPMRDDAVLTRAILAVISSKSSTSPLSLTSNYQQMQRDQAYQRQIGAVNGAFEAYDSSYPPNLGAGQSLYGQRMIKTSINILRRIRMMKREAPMEEPRPTSNQLQHMISERKRREKINESFLALRMLLPPGSKKDKVSVLVNTKNYLMSLLSQISDLQERNRILEVQLLHEPDHETSPILRPEGMQLQPSDHQEGEGAGEDNHSTKQVQVHVSTMPESTSEAIRIHLRLTVVLREDCDITALVLRVLECLKEMGNTSLISVNADTRSSQAGPIATLNLRFQARQYKVEWPTNCFSSQKKVQLLLYIFQASDWNEESFKESVTRAGNLEMNRNP